MLTDKKLIGVLRAVAHESNPFGINDICLYYGLPRNCNGRDILEGEQGITAKRVGRLVMNHNDFVRADGVSNGHVKWICLSVRDKKNEEIRERNSYFIKE